MPQSALIEQPSRTVLADDLIDMANWLHYQAGTIADSDVSDRLRDLAGEIQEIAKEVDRNAPSPG